MEIAHAEREGSLCSGAEVSQREACAALAARACHGFRFLRTPQSEFAGFAWEVSLHKRCRFSAAGLAKPLLVLTHACRRGSMHALPSAYSLQARDCCRQRAFGRAQAGQVQGSAACSARRHKQVRLGPACTTAASCCGRQRCTLWSASCTVDTGMVRFRAGETGPKTGQMAHCSRSLGIA